MSCLLRFNWVKLPRNTLPEGKGLMGSWARLAARAAFRPGQADYCGYRNEVELASWVEYRRARFARDLPITRVYYYNGSSENLKNDPLGWSERDGIMQDCVLVWDAETSRQGRTPPSYILAPRVYNPAPSVDSGIATTAVYTWPTTAENE